MQLFHGNQQSGLVILNETNVLFQFRMSAVSYINGEPVEGDLSIITAESFVLIPKPGTYSVHIEDCIVS